MTVSTQESYVVYTASGSQNVFDFDFPFVATSDVKVYLDGSFLVETGYVVTGNVGNEGGNVVLFEMPASGVDVAIVRETPYTQETDYPPYGPFPAESHENALDKLTMLVQQARDAVETVIAAGFINTGEWQPTKAYKTLNVCIYAGNYYTCKEDFVSGTVFDENNWNLILDFTDVYSAVAQAAQSEANAAASAAAAASSESNVKTSEQLAAASEANSAVSENNAANCAAEAQASAIDAANSAAEAASGTRVDAVAQDYFTATAGQTTFSLSAAPAADTALIVYMNSRKLRLTEDYTVVGRDIVLNEGAAVGDEIDVVNFNLSVLVVP